MRLSPHFTLGEMTRSSTATRLSIQNIPGEREIHSLQAICRNILEPIRAHFKIPFAPSSAYRCDRLNSAVGSSPRSQHVLGEAVDIELVGVSNFDLACWITSNTVFDQLILEYYSEDDPSSGWVHVSHKSPEVRGTPNVNRGEILRFDGHLWKLGLLDNEESEDG